MGKVLRFIEPEGTLRRKLQASIQQEREKRTVPATSHETVENEAITPLFRRRRKQRF